MATTSFDKAFVVTDEKSINDFKRKANSPISVVVRQRDYASDKLKGIAQLKQRLSNLETC